MTMRAIALWILMVTPAISGVLALTTSSDVTGRPGETVGWGFSLSSDPVNWISVTAAFPIVESDPSIGFFTDFIGPQGGPVSFAIPAAAAWAQSFDLLQGFGFGTFEISSLAAPGAVDTGTFLVLFDVYSGDPLSCGGCLVDSGSVQADFTVTVAAPSPEPGSALVLISGGLLLACCRGSLASKLAKAQRA